MQQVRYDRKHDRYGGVAIYCSINFPLKHRTDLETDRLEHGHNTHNTHYKRGRARERGWRERER